MKDRKWIRCLQVAVVWSLTNGLRHQFITENFGMEMLWYALTIFYAILLGHEENKS